MSIPLRVHLTPQTVDPRDLPGSIAVIVDVLRASTTIAAALAAGATGVVPCAEPEDALRRRAASPGPAVLGGERRGVRIDGFDLGNSPSEYTPAAVGGRTVLFTTTNGTRAVLRCLDASAVLIGCLTNRKALCALLRGRGLPVHIVCAGTDGAMCLDDAVAAGAIAHGLVDGPGTPSFDPGDDDAARLCLAAFASTGGEPGRLATALRAGRGGRNLVAIGLSRDIDDCAAIDSSNAVPELDRRTGTLVLAERPA